MMSNWKKVMLATLISIMTIAPFATGCGDKAPAKNPNSNSAVTTAAKNDNNKNSDSSSTIQLPPGVDTEGVLGKAIESNKISVTLDEIYEPAKAPESRDAQFIICKFTLKNNSGDTYTVNTLDNFAVFVDSKENENALSASAPVIAATKIGEDVTPLTGDIASGDTLQGIISMEVPKEWSSLKLVYTPAKGTSNDTISYTITADQITPKY